MRGLWDYATHLYAVPEVKQGLLTLQDRFRVDVNLTLWSIWCARFGLSLDDEEAQAVILGVENMTRHVTRPLRGIRRYLATPRHGFDPAMQEALRTQSLQVEIASEELILRRLDDATRQRVHANPELQSMAMRAERLFTLARASMDMPTMIADEEGPFSPMGLFRDVLKLAEEHG